MKRDAAPPVDFDAIFDDVFPALYRYCHRLTGDADLAEDVAQESFFRLLTHQVEGPPPGLRVWLFRVATHLVRDRYRVSENRRRLLEAYPHTPALVTGPERELERREVTASVRAVLETLQERDRLLLLMREEGFSYQEMAAAVDVQPSSVGTLLARALRRFSEAYQGSAAPEAADTVSGRRSASEDAEREEGMEEHDALG